MDCDRLNSLTVLKLAKYHKNTIVNNTEKEDPKTTREYRIMRCNKTYVCIHVYNQTGDSIPFSLYKRANPQHTISENADDKKQYRKKG